MHFVIFGDCNVRVVASRDVSHFLVLETFDSFWVEEGVKRVMVERADFLGVYLIEVALLSAVSPCPHTTVFA
jgi:hypothetical protein